MKTIFNLAICIHKSTFSILLVFLPHTNIIVSRRINVASVTMFLLSLELALVQMAILCQMSTNTFSFILIVKLSDISCIFYFKFTIMELSIKVDWIVLFNFKQVYRTQLFPFLHKCFMTFILLCSNIWLCFQHINQTLWQLWFNKIPELPVMNFHLKYSPGFTIDVSWEILTVVSQIVKDHFENSWIAV